MGRLFRQHRFEVRDRHSLSSRRIEHSLLVVVLRKLKRFAGITDPDRDIEECVASDFFVSRVVRVWGPCAYKVIWLC